MSKAKGQSNFKMIKRTKDHRLTFREAIKERPMGWNLDLWTKIEFLVRQIALTLETEVARQKKQYDLEALEECLERWSRLRMKARNLIDQMYPPEVIKKDIAEIMSILGEISPEARDRIVRKMEKRKGGHS